MGSCVAVGRAAHHAALGRVRTPLCRLYVALARMGDRARGLGRATTSLGASDYSAWVGVASGLSVIIGWPIRGRGRGQGPPVDQSGAGGPKDSIYYYYYRGGRTGGPEVSGMVSHTAQRIS